MAGLDLETKPWWVALIVGLVLGGGAIWASDRFLFKNIKIEIASQQAQLTELQRQVREGKAAEARLPQFQEEAQRLEAELQRLLRILPTMKQTDELIKRIKSLTERGAHRFVNFQPGAFAKKDFYSEWPIAVTVEGGYHELALFFDRLARFSRIINVDALQIAKTSRQSVYSISATFTMKTFIYGDVTAQGGRP
jgi:type IV pilus assembly protein PilO